jgi:hypothetical protein
MAQRELHRSFASLRMTTEKIGLRSTNSLRYLRHYSVSTLALKTGLE